jgi:23S rRNA pseudouridine2605 synthase
MPNPNPKLHAFLAQAGVASRRKAETFIQEGRVKVNRQLATIGQRINPNTDRITVDGKAVIATQTTRTFLLNKPTGIISTTSDELGRATVISYAIQELQRQHLETGNLPRLYPVGRLDLDSDGLLLITNDGELAQRFTHPSYEVQKTYRVVVSGQPTEKALSHLQRGVKLDEGYTAPARVEFIQSDSETTTLEISIHEGRFHQVKRMCERVGYPVLHLTRIALGPFSLADLRGQRIRELSPAELQLLFAPRTETKLSEPV